MNDEIKEKIILLRKDGLGYKKIAKELGVNLNSVKSFCRNQRNKKSKLEIINCKYCKEIINTKGKRGNVKFCSKACKTKWWNANKKKLNRKTAIAKTCANCNKEFFSYKNEKRKYCTHACYIEHRFRGCSNG
ncbi:sigma-70 region 4 domain-containing protein [Ligilactobacillus ceti]|uniref:sigma-70 region 4 domain-containing protein n=1 Tax=Ligilactobacillus ceti TaxID=395085 RepID=UPI0004860221|nr:sigma-70 region 4 domain-containing protein [Ligilactobacillus ceti]